MNFDDESILSAYIDGELDPEERQRVEAAILADPFLEEQVRRLSSVHQWVGQLARPSLDVDLTSSVLQAIDRRRTYGPASRLARRLAGWRTVAEYAVAASIVLSLSMGLRTVLQSVPPNLRTPVQVAKTIAPVRKPDVRVAGWPPKRIAPTTTPRTTSPVEVKPALVSASTSASALTPVRQDAQGDRRRMRELLANPGPRLVFVVTDVIGGHASDQVNSLVKEMPRLDSSYGRITVGQGIVIDPNRPDEATVYALAMNDRELERFREKLQGTFPTSLQEAGANSEMVARLSDVGQIAFFNGPSTADLLPAPREAPHVATKSASKARPSEKLAYPHEFDGLPVVEVHESDNSGSSQEGPTPQQLRSGPHPSNRDLKDPDPPTVVANRDASSPKGAGPDDPAKGKARGPRPSSVVLVWVTTPKGPGTRAR